MSATIHLVLDGLGADRAGRLTAAYREASAEFGAALVIVPTRRHAGQFRESLGTGIAPLVFDLQAFADELVRVHEPTLRPHSDADRRLLLDSVLAELRESELPYFAGVADTRGFAEAAAGYVAELKEAGVDLRQLLKASNGRLSAELNRHMQATRIFERYQRRLTKLHRFDAPDRLGRATGLWAAGDRQPFHRVRSVFLVGFASLTRHERQLLDAVRESVEHVWLELPDGEGEAFAGPRALREWATGPVGEQSLFNEGPEVIVEAPSLSGGRQPPVEVEAQGADAPRSGKGIGGLGSVSLIEAPGELGEARLVARRIRALLAAGVAPGRVLVVARHFTPVAIDLYREVFDEYAIPHDAEGAEALGRVPAVACLLRAWRLPEEGWPFAGVAAVLRSAYFRPDWPEVRADSEVPAKSEALLRMLGEARGREAYLTAVRTWEHTPPDPLEDEQAEEPVRKRKQRLAARCRPFLERFFQAWDRLKGGGTAEVAIARLKAFADDIGLSRAAQGDDAAGLARFWQELGRWAKGESSGGSRKAVRPERLVRVLSAIASSACRARTPRGEGVPLLSAERAAGLDCDYLFLVGLGEGSWPDLSAPVSLLDDAERERLRKAGFALPDPAARLGTEQLLFRRLVSAPRCELVLSYAAVDEQGQALLPSTFLRELLAEFPDGVPTTRRRMLLDGYFDQEPMSEAELRVQYAHGWPTDGRPWALGQDLVDNLRRAQEVALARFRSPDHGPYDGALRHPAVTVELAKRFGSQKVFSPTALETYVACPFRFFLEQVLRLEVLDDPAEGVEHTRRGAAVHRALARFHARLNTVLPGALAGAELPAGVTPELVTQIVQAAEEYAARAPSRASAELWRLEGERLRHAAARYRGHWHEFRKPWREKQATPTPHTFEADFGVPGENVPEPLVITVGEVEVRIGGRIDRVDVAELGDEFGFWVIDYKTGRAANYQASQVERFEKLQLPLYALAVERVLLKGKRARPLGLAYWLVTDTGAKGMLPAGKRATLAWLTDAEKWLKFRTQLEAWVATLVTHVRAGDFALAPRSEHCTDTCAFGPVCRIAQSRNSGKTFALALPVVNAKQNTE